MRIGPSSQLCALFRLRLTVEIFERNAPTAFWRTFFRSEFCAARYLLCWGITLDADPAFCLPDHGCQIRTHPLPESVKGGFLLICPFFPYAAYNSRIK